MKNICIGLLAHVDSGKTTLSEAMLYRCGEIRRLGRVDHRDTFLDTDPLEKRRGITIFSKQAVMEYGGSRIFLLDTPGHVDFAAETERTLSVLDCAVLVVSASAGVQAHTETLFRILRARGIPTVVFVNKMDVALKKPAEIVSDIRERLGDGFVDVSPERSAEDLSEDISMCSEELMELVLEGVPGTGQESGDIRGNDQPGSAFVRLTRSGRFGQAIAGALRENTLMPCVFGSALRSEGVEDLLDVITAVSGASDTADAGRDAQAEEDNRNAGREKLFGARVYKIARDDQGIRLTFVRVTSGELSVRQELTGISGGGEPWNEKINQIRIYSGEKYTTPEKAREGEICALTGLSQTSPGDGLGIEKTRNEEVLEPFLDYAVIPGEGAPDMHMMLSDLRKLSEEDPKLNVSGESATGEIHMSLMGEIQLEIIRELVKTRFGYEIEFGPGKILYRERIAEPAEGVGHFEPLRHYAEVHLIMEPGEPGSGIVISDEASEDSLDRNWHRLIITHIEEKLHKGILTGSPLTDTKITLAAGRASKKHTEGGDFREATYRAVRNGLMKGGCVLLEPWFDFELDLLAENVGRAMSDIVRMGGTFSEPATDGGRSRIRGTAPASEMIGYQSELVSYSHGNGRMSVRLRGYDECHDAEDVIAASGYDPERDIENTADSVFCIHGASGIVNWREVEEYMDLPPVLDKRRLRTQSDGSGDMSDAGPGRGTKSGVTATAAELDRIFEKTYGPIKRDPLTAPGRNRNRVKFRSGDPRGEAGTERVSVDVSHPQRTIVFIDGYNVIHSWDDLLGLSAKDLGAAREALADRMCNYAGYTRYEVVLVFDAYRKAGGKGSKERFRNIDIVYTKENETADSYIERVTQELAKPVRSGAVRVRVVSSDALVQQISLGHGALRIPAREFLEEIRSYEER